MGRRKSKEGDHPVASSSHVQLETHETQQEARQQKRRSESNKPKSKRKKTEDIKSTDKKQKEKEGTMKRGKRKVLSHFPMMPFDVIYEILARLTVKDVVSISRVNKEWCTLLSSRSMIHLWKELRLQEGVPDPHPDISESSWAVFLFGGLNCEVCGTKNIQAPDFGIRRRVCSSCKKEKLVPKYLLGEKYPQYDVVIAKYLPYTTYNGSWLHAYDRETPFFWPEDIKEIGERWKKLLSDIRSGVPDARATAVQYKKHRLSIVAAIKSSVPECMEWCENLINQKSEAKFEASERRKEAIFARFREAGYTDQDLVWIDSDSSVTQGRDLTERIWKKIKPKLEETLLPRKRDRLVRERSYLIAPAYTTYMKSIKPMKRITIPTLSELYQFPAFDDLASAPDDVDNESPVVQQISSQLPALIADWQENYRSDLRRMFFALRIPSSFSHTVLSEVENDVLEAAVAVCTCLDFGCMNNPNGALLGWESAMQHRSCERFHPSFRVPETANPIATDLIRLAGFNPKTASIEDMDQTGLRVLCKVCVNNNWEGNTQVGRRLHKADVFTWRQALSHALHEDRHSEHSEWEVLSPEQRKHIIETHDSRLGYPQTWSCNHCAEHYGHTETLVGVKEHLRNIHHVSKPVFPDDLIPLRDKWVWPPRFKLMLWIDNVPHPPDWIPHGRFVCKHCSRCCFELPDLQEHILDNHHQATVEEYTVRKLWQGWMPPPNLDYPPEPE